MLVVKTLSGFTYEIDTGNKKIRCLLNANEREPTDRQGKDKEWKAFKDISRVVIGSGILISWHPMTTPLFHNSPPNFSPTTLTSPVIEIE